MESRESPGGCILIFILLIPVAIFFYVQNHHVEVGIGILVVAGILGLVAFIMFRLAEEIGLGVVFTIFAVVAALIGIFILVD